MEESQEHLEDECPGCDFKRRTLKMHTLGGRQTFWRRMKAKIEEKRKKKKGEGLLLSLGLGASTGRTVWWNNWLMDRLVVHSRRTMFDYAD